LINVHMDLANLCRRTINHWINILTQKYLTKKYWTSVFFASAIAFGPASHPVCSVNADTGQTIKPKVTLAIRINVPHNLRAIDSCRLYPYPVAPPHKKREVEKLSINTKNLQTQLLAIGYSAISRKDRPYPSGGWRMQYAFRAAQAKSGLGLPHTILTMYAWEEEIEPYVRTEIIRINSTEKQRQERYEMAQQMFDEHRTDLEVQAFNDGLFPHDVVLRPWHGDHQLGKVALEKTNWWIVALHKTPGLQYYWLWPVKLSDDAEQLVELNEDNAIHIEGSW